MRFLTADLPGTGGVLKVSPEDFVVEELPAYEPCGTGDHVYVTLEKRDVSTPDAIRALARALGVNDRDVGSAGMKDRFAVTRQRLSLPPPVTPEAALAVSIPGLRVLDAARHGNKLRTGHLRGNRFILRVRKLAVPVPEAAARARAILERLASSPGVPNWYGEQRFGARGDNAARGRALLKGARPSPPPRDGREKRLLLSAWQSGLFNRYLDERLRDGLLGRVLPGDILRKTETGGMFESADPSVDQPRLDAGEVVPTGPMFGAEMRAPTAGTEAALREATLLASDGIGPDDLRRGGSLAEGTRRPLAVPLGEPSCELLPDDTIELRFVLPAGAYATVAAAEILKNSIVLN